MNSKRFIRLSLCLTLILLFLTASFQIAIDPLFQYHKPWFGLKFVVADERYINAGVAKNSIFDNAIIGNSMSENFTPSDVDNIFGGESVSLVMSGSNLLDWSCVLDILRKKNDSIENILINLDPCVFEASPNRFEHDLPTYLYDESIINDVSYWFNFSIINNYTFRMLQKNMNNSIPDQNTHFMWDDGNACSKENALAAYKRPDISNENLDINDYTNNIDANFDLIIPYISSMKDTRFTFFVSPFSMLYWDGENRTNNIQKQKAGYLEMCKILTEYDNVSLYMWTDEEMMKIMSDLDNYRDDTHYSAEISKQLLNRIKNQEGLITTDNYNTEVDKLFDYIESYDYERLFT